MSAKKVVCLMLSGFLLTACGGGGDSTESQTIEELAETQEAAGTEDTTPFNSNGVCLDNDSYTVTQLGVNIFQFELPEDACVGADDSLIRKKSVPIQLENENPVFSLSSRAIFTSSAE